eukprot:245085-Pleurochrysis_carterae.AAC.1
MLPIECWLLKGGGSDGACGGRGGGGGCKLLGSKGGGCDAWWKAWGREGGGGGAIHEGVSLVFGCGEAKRAWVLKLGRAATYAGAVGRA